MMIKLDCKKQKKYFLKKMNLKINLCKNIRKS